MPDSIAIDTGNSNLTHDQRGILRPQGADDDRGAVEYDCGKQPWIAYDETTLNRGITCYNAVSTASSYTISVTQNISLTARTEIIENRTNAILHIEGNSYVVDSQRINGLRPFSIHDKTHITINGITITGGRYPSGNGGAIYNSGTLTITNSTFSNNSANSGGAIANSIDFFDSTLTIFNSTFSNNSASYGGAIDSHGNSLTINNSTFSDNSGDSGGAINNSRDVIINNSTFSNNTSSIGGGILNTNDGAIIIDSTTFSENSATDEGGGGIYNDRGLITISNSIVANSVAGGDCITIAGTVIDAGQVIDAGNNIVKDNSCGFSNGSDPLLAPLANNGGSTWTHALLPGSPAIDAGNSDLTTDQRGIPRPQGVVDDIGAFEYVNVIDCNGQPWLVNTANDLNEVIDCYNAITVAGSYTISLNQNISLTVSTPPIYNENSGVALLLEGNRFAVDGQGNAGVRPFTIGPNTTATLQNITIMGGNMVGSGNGGGIANLGTLTVSNSTLVGNLAYDGGAIYNNDGILSINNSTISSNSADNGGGIYNFGTVTINSSTISDNYANINSQSIYNNNGTVTLSNTIIANDSNGNCSGAITSGGYNLASDNSCNLNAPGDLNNTDPLHVPFIDNNNNWTYALLPGSPAIDAGNTTLPTDQRGIARPQGTTDDIGAFESQGFILSATATVVNDIATFKPFSILLSTSTATPQTTLINTPFPNPLSLTVSSTNDEPIAGGSITFSAPASGASVTFSETVVTIEANGAVSLPVTANETTGSYEVTANTPGNIGEPLIYQLTNALYTTFMPIIVSNETNIP